MIIEQKQEIAGLRAQVQEIWDAFKAKHEESGTERNKAAKAIKHALEFRHLAVKGGALSESESMDYLNKMMNDVDPVDISKIPNREKYEGKLP